MSAATTTTLYEAHVGESVYVNVEQDDPTSAPYVAVWGSGETLTTEQAVTLAAAVVEAVCLARGDSVTTATVVRNLTKAIASRGPIEIDTMEALAGLLGVNQLDLLTP